MSEPTFRESCTLAEHKLLKRIRQLCRDKNVLVALVKTLSRDTVIIRALPEVSKETAAAWWRALQREKEDV